MAIKQLSVFIENKQGKLSDAIKVVSDANINIKALSIGDAKDFGILRMIVSDSAKAKELLSEDTIVNVTDVLAVKMDDKEGSLYKILKIMEEDQINVEYTYAFTSHVAGNAYVVFRLNDVAAAERLLADAGFEILTEDQIGDL